MLSGKDITRSDNQETERINEEFNKDLEKQIQGDIKAGYIYKLGKPSKVLLSTGFPNAEIEMSSTILKNHSISEKHPFELKEIKDLVKHLQSPLAIFKYGDKSKAQNVIIEITQKDKNYLVGIHFNQNKQGIEISDIRGIFPKDNAEWLNWITQDKLLYVDKKRIQNLISKQRKTLAEVTYLDLNSIAKILQDFDNPKLSAEKMQNNSNISEDNTSDIQAEAEEEDKFTDEELLIIDKAKTNGTYMKAPNGSPTNLTEKQWVQVRTKSFKKWFGDWEKSIRIEKLRKAKPVEITGKEYEGKYELNRNSAKAWIKDNVKGEYINKDTNEKISVTNVGVKEVTSHGERDEAHLKSLIAIPTLISDSIFIEEIPNTKDNNKYDSYRYYVCGLKIGGVDYTAKIVVGIKGDSRYYDHRLTKIEKGTLIDNLNGLSNTVVENQNTLNPRGKDTELISLLQTNSSKVVDENGEPMVVYHGGQAEFTEFSTLKIGSSTGTSDGRGFYFTTDNNYAMLNF